MKTSYVEFEITDPNRFNTLRVIVDALRAAKQSGAFPPDDYWLAFFDQEALAHFWWPTEKETQDWARLWYGKSE